MKRLIGLIGLCFGVWFLPACSENSVQATPLTVQSEKWHANWDVTPKESSLKFTAIYMGESFEGSFGSFDVKIKFDPDDLNHAKVIASIDLSSGDAGEIERTEALPGKDWFFVKSFPRAVFEATEFTHIGAENYEAKGTLTLRGVSKGIALPFSLKIENDHAVMQGGLTLNRRDFDVGRGMWKSDSDVGHHVKVNIIIKATKIVP